MVDLTFANESSNLGAKRELHTHVDDKALSEWFPSTLSRQLRQRNGRGVTPYHVTLE